jgi:hypothetical protein
MAILRSLDGMFYNIPDDQLEQHLVPPDEVKQHLGNALEASAPAEKKAASGGISLPQAGKAVLSLFAGSGDGGGTREAEVTPHGSYCGWRNCWRNCWRRNCWRNCW